MRRLALALVPLIGLVAACGGPDLSGASRAAGTFQRVVATDPGQACALLSERTRQTLESDEDAPCTEAIGGLDLPAAAPVRKADVYGDNARVTTGSDVLFLARFPDGWKVMAAGCTAQPNDEPYDCTVSGG